MTTFKLRALFQNDGWISPAYVTVNSKGIVESISSKSDKKIDHDLNCFAIPGFQNAHSHAFQYAMAGLTERHATSQAPDDFWSWRDAMYKLALTVEPTQLEHIAAMLYSEMLRHGYTNVAEFHYLHHDKNGKPYGLLSEMSERLISAAKTVGIGITLVPIFYQKGGFGKAPTEGQKRFISTTENDYLKLFEAVKKSCDNYDFANVAIGIHSMRGVEPDVIAAVAKHGEQSVPFHIHISEQLKEVEDALSYLGKRPVEWMLDEISLSDRFHLVHATHLTNQEVNGIAKAGAHVVLCPSTEGNLGDGIFPLIDFQRTGGRWSIGTDSHVGLNPLEELRILDYGQRLISHKRNIFYDKTEGDSGAYAVRQTTISGRKAMNNYDEDYFKVGAIFNAALFDASAPLLENSSLENLISTIIYSCDASIHRGVIANGKLVQPTADNMGYEKIKSNFKATMLDLGNRF